MKSDVRPPFKDLLRRHRLAAGLSQEALAERAQLSPNAIRQLERGRRTSPRASTVGLLVDALELRDAEREAFVDSVFGEALPVASREPSRSAPPPQAPLPTQLTPLVGREADVAALLHLLCPSDGRSPARLLTLTGPGGIGKTRLSLAVAGSARDAFPDGVLFVDLAAIRDPALALSTLARALGTQESGTRSTESLIDDHVRDLHMLLVLDNLEQVLPVGAAISALLARAPGCAALVTSRVALGVHGEQRFPVQPLALPNDTEHAPLASLANYSAIRLFVDRAQTVRPSFQLDDVSAPAVAAICRTVDGLPLAVELAARLVRLLSPQEILERLTRRLELHTTAPNVPARHKSLRATLEWSLELLDEDARALFRELGVFAGDAAVASVEEICRVAGQHVSLDTLGALVDHSLVHVTEVDGESRVGMLETIREFAADLLAANGDEPALRRQHAVHYTELVETGWSTIEPSQHVAWFRRMEREHPNLRTALQWSLDEAEIETGMRLAASLWPFWYVRAYLGEGRAWLEALLACEVSVPPRVGAMCTRGAGALAMQQGDWPAVERWSTTSIDLFRQVGDMQGVADMLNTRAVAAREQMQLERAVELQQESLAAYRDVHDVQGVAVALNNMGMTVFYAGDLNHAESLFRESLALRREQQDVRGTAWVLNNLGAVARSRGELSELGALSLEALQLSRLAGDRLQQARACEGLASSVPLDTTPTVAARCFGAAARLRQDVGSEIPETDRASYATAVSRARCALGPDAFQTAWEDGERLDLDSLLRQTTEALASAPAERVPRLT
jgi:predicted ATPase/transcriptional regulator with XRE-family HTH domain